MEWIRAVRGGVVSIASLVGIGCAQGGGSSAVHAPEAAAPATVVATSARGCPARDASRPDRRPTVAVMYFNISAMTNSAEYAPLSKGIADMMVVSLRANCGIRVVEREQLERLLKEQNIPEDRVDPATRVRIGKLLGAKHMIMGSVVVDMRDRMEIAASSIDVETSEHDADVLARDAAKNLLDLVPTVAKKLNDALHLPPMEVPVFEGRRPADRTDEVTALRLYSRALEEQDRGNKKRAIELYRAALDKFPDYPPAQQALRKIAAVE